VTLQFNGHIETEPDDDGYRTTFHWSRPAEFDTEAFIRAASKRFADELRRHI
jgi:hypothetical protein